MIDVLYLYLIHGLIFVGLMIFGHLTIKKSMPEVPLSSWFLCIVLWPYTTVIFIKLLLKKLGSKDD